MVRVSLGTGAGDPAITGTDALTGRAQTLEGNYGVADRFSLQYAVRGVLAVAPRGGDWGGVVNSGGVLTKLPPGVGALHAEPLQLGIIGPTATTVDGALTLLTAGGSNLPTDVLFLPVR